MSELDVNMIRIFNNWGQAIAQWELSVSSSVAESELTVQKASEYVGIIARIRYSDEFVKQKLEYLQTVYLQKLHNLMKK